jgi:hypothetical protein
MNRSEMIKLIRTQPNKHYVYILRDSHGVPFYVGLGQGERLLAHEEEAKDPQKRTAKCQRIREILDAGGHIDYHIDSWHDSTPWHREGELIRELERTNLLTNLQRYAPAKEVGGIVMRKYAAAYAEGADVRDIPADFPYTNTRLMVGLKKPGSRAKVYGRIYKVLYDAPGITGADLIARLHQIDWSDVKSAYAAGRSMVSGKWLADYIKGGFLKKNQCITLYEDK